MNKFNKFGIFKELDDKAVYTIKLDYDKVKQ